MFSGWFKKKTHVLLQDSKTSKVSSSPAHSLLTAFTWMVLKNAPTPRTRHSPMSSQVPFWKQAWVFLVPLAFGKLTSSPFSREEDKLSENPVWPLPPSASPTSSCLLQPPWPGRTVPRNSLQLESSALPSQPFYLSSSFTSSTVLSLISLDSV